MDVAAVAVYLFSFYWFPVRKILSGLKQGNVNGPFLDANVMNLNL